MAGKKLNAIITIGGAVSGTLRGAISAAKGGLDGIGKSIHDLTARQRELNRAMSDWRPGGSAANLRLDLMQRESAGITNQLGLLRRRQAIEEKINGLQEARSRYAANIGKAVLAGGALLGAAGVAFKDAAAFNYEMQLIGNTANMSASQIKALGREIIGLSRSTGQSAQDMQKSMGFLVAAGLEADVASKMLRTIGRTATAAGADLEDVSRAAFVLNDTLGVQPDGMQKALDVLAQAGKEGNVELRDMAKQLPVLGSGFQALKMKGTEATATLGAALEIARKGAADPDEAANNMKNFLAKVMAPDTLKKAKKNFNLDLYKIITDAQTKGKNPFEAAMVGIMKATGGDQKKLGELFADMQVQNFLRPMMQNWDEYQRIKDKALSASGVTDADFDKIAGTSQFQLKQLSDNFGRLKLAIGEALDGPGAGFLGFLNTVIDKMTVFAQENPKVVATIVAVGGALAGATIAINATAWAFASLQIAALRTQGVFLAMRASSLVTGLVSIAGAIWASVIPAFSALGTAMLATPIGWAIGAVALFAGAAYLVYRNWDGIKAFFTDMWSSVKAMFDESINWLVTKLNWAGQKWRDLKGFFGFGGGDAAPAGGNAGTPKRAYGGPVRAGRSYVVGERRPELFVPNADGRIVPHLPQGGAGAGGAMVASNDNRQYTFNITAAPGQNPKAIADEVERRIRSSGRSSALFDHAMGY